MEQDPIDIHKTVLADEVIEYLAPSSGNIYIDGTLGLGGHTERILEKSAPAGRVIGFEWDDDAARLAKKRLSRFNDRLKIIPASYSELREQLEREGLKGADGLDGLILDLGVSSLQLDRGERGFSFQTDAPLDMRMDRRRETTAATLINTLTKDELADIFYNYGEERQSRRIASRIVEARIKDSITTTGQLASIVSDAIPRKYHPKKIHVATKVFQALRIAVNNELKNLVKLLSEAPQVLKPGARVCIISFHSLEDRIVKQAFTSDPSYKVITRRPIVADDKEISGNPRARSAKLRVATTL